MSRRFFFFRVSQWGWVGEAGVDPGPQLADLLGSERVFFLRRHGFLLIDPRCVVDQPTFGAFRLHYRSAAVASGQQRIARIDPEAALLLFLAMTLETALFEQRLDVLHEIECRRHGRQLAGIDRSGFGRPSFKGGRDYEGKEADG